MMHDPEFVRVDIEILWLNKVRIRLRVINISGGLSSARDKAIYRKCLNRDIDRITACYMNRSKHSPYLATNKFILRELEDMHRALLQAIDIDRRFWTHSDDEVSFKLWDLRHIINSGDKQLVICYNQNDGRESGRQWYT